MGHLEPAKKRVRGLREAAAFLTRVPLATGGSHDVASALPWFPVVGALVGLMVAAVYAGAAALLPDFPAAALAVGAGVVLTGAFHEDGLADFADAMGGWTPEEARRILKDPTHGTYGVSALVLVILMRVAALTSLEPRTAVAVLPAAYAIGRGAAVALLAFIPTATDDGLGALYGQRVSRRQVAVVGAVTVTVATAALGVWAAPAALVAILCVVAVGRIARRKIGGATGDVLGAAEQIVEAGVLLLGAAVATQQWSGLPWWR